MQCSIIIPTWRRPEQLARALDSIAAQSEPALEAIVVVDGEDTSTRLLAESYRSQTPLRWIFHTHNQGLATARNTGAAAVANGEILLFLDDDMTAAPECLANHVKHHQNGGDIAVLGRIVQRNKIPGDTATERYLQHRAAAYFVRVHENLVAGRLDPERSIWFGANCSIRRALFLQTGGFDPVLSSTDEEMEFGHRLVSAGVRFVGEPRAIAVHWDTKVLTHYWAHSWRQSACNDIYRICQRKQRNRQTQGLVRMYEGKLLSRWKEQMVWKYPRVAAKAATMFRHFGDLTGRSIFYGRWLSLANSCEYWQAVKAQGWTAASLRQIAGQPLRVLAMHSVSAPVNRHERLYYTSPQRFRWLLNHLQMRGRSFVELADWLSGPLAEGSIALTFDDGYDDFYFEVFPLTCELHLKPTVFVVTDQIGKTNSWDEAVGCRSRRLFSVEQMREMHRHGVAFGSHTLTHPWLPAIGDVELRKEVRESKLRLEDALGVEVISFCYPFGGVDERVRHVVAEAGYKIAVTTRVGLNRWGSDPLLMNRIEVNEASTRLGLLAKIRAPLQFGRPRLLGTAK